MPKMQVFFYQEEDKEVPVLEWLQALLKQDRKGYANCMARIQQLIDLGYELRRPMADFLSDGIYELRVKHVNVQYRILYFFHDRNIAILTHSIVKEGASVPKIHIKKAIERKRLFESNPDFHTFKLEFNHEENE
jgi:phage-related protein